MPRRARPGRLIRFRTAYYSESEDDGSEAGSSLVFDGEEDSEGHTEGLIEGTHYILSLDNSEHSNRSRSITPTSLYSASSSLFAPADSRDGDFQNGGPSGEWFYQFLL